jgi:hypothetical protein
MDKATGVLNVFPEGFRCRREVCRKTGSLQTEIRAI